jgi:hypothetical protein
MKYKAELPEVFVKITENIDEEMKRKYKQRLENQIKIFKDAIPQNLHEYVDGEGYLSIPGLNGKIMFEPDTLKFWVVFRGGFYMEPQSVETVEKAIHLLMRAEGVVEYS